MFVRERGKWVWCQNGTEPPARWQLYRVWLWPLSSWLWDLDWLPNGTQHKKEFYRGHQCINSCLAGLMGHVVLNTLSNSNHRWGHITLPSSCYTVTRSEVISGRMNKRDCKWWSRGMGCPGHKWGCKKSLIHCNSRVWCFFLNTGSWLIIIMKYQVTKGTEFWWLGIVAMSHRAGLHKCNREAIVDPMIGAAFLVLCSLTNKFLHF